MSDCTEERFLKDVAEHEMQILHEDGVYRHIRFKRPNTGCMHFDLITYPGFLVYSGDMGCYVFSRVHDMFEFFRIRKNDWNYAKDGGLSTNPHYWSEKLQAVSGSRSNAGAMEFDEEKFKSVINGHIESWMSDNDLNDEERQELRDEVDREVLGSLFDGEHAAYLAAHSFSHKAGGKVFHFDDLFEHSFNSYTFHFIWCCFALAWGIKKYDKKGQS